MKIIDIADFISTAWRLSMSIELRYESIILGSTLAGCPGIANVVMLIEFLAMGIIKSFTFFVSIIPIIMCTG